LLQKDPSQATAANTFVKSSGMLNLRLSMENIKLGGGQIANASLWVRNATDSQHLANMIDFGPGFANLKTGYFVDPRTVGVSLNVKF
jgi:outer membrane receptor protein involved in Fe transport